MAKQSPLTPGDRVVSFAIADHSTLRNKAVVVMLKLDGRLLARFRGTFPATEGLTIQYAGAFVAPGTIDAETLIAGAPIATARDGVLSITPGG